MNNIEILIGAILLDMNKINSTEMGTMKEIELSSHLDGLSRAFEIVTEKRVFYDYDRSREDRLIYLGFTVEDGGVYRINEPF